VISNHNLSTGKVSCYLGSQADVAHKISDLGHYFPIIVYLKTE